MQGGAGDVFVVKDGDQYVWTSRGDFSYRVESVDLIPAVLPKSQALQFPSRLLAARYEVVKLVGRGDDLNALSDWAAGQASFAVRVIHAAGGEGKTRLASQFARDLASSGWAVVTAKHSQEARLTGQPTQSLAAGADGLLIVVDYADRWPSPDLLSMLADHLWLTGRVRVLFLARGVRGWWRDVEDALLDVGIEKVDEVALSNLAPAWVGDSSDDANIFNLAVKAFAPYLDVDETSIVSVPDTIDVSSDGQALTICMAALVATDAVRSETTAPSDLLSLSEYLLQRERRGWRQLADAGRVSSTFRQLGHVSMVAALTGALSFNEGIQAVRAAEIAASEPDADQVLRDHQVAYPAANPGTVLEPLTPDRLAEDYVALSVPGIGIMGAKESDLSDPWASAAVARLMGIGGQEGNPEGIEKLPSYARSAITVMVEATTRWPHLLTQVVKPLMIAHPVLAVVAGGATVIRLAELFHDDADLIELIYRQLPERGNVEYDQAAAYMAERRVELGPAVNADPAQYAALRTEMAYRYGNIGRQRDAKNADQDAVKAWRVLSDADTGEPAYPHELARSLNDLSIRLAALGEREPATEMAQEVVDIWRELSDPDTGEPAYLHELARSLNNLGARLAENDERLGVFEAHEAVAIWQELVDMGNDTYLPNLALSLTNFAAAVVKFGSSVHNPLYAAEAAVEIWRELTKPDTGDRTYLPDLARSLNNLSTIYVAVGLLPLAYPSINEAVDIWQELADPKIGNPGAHQPEYARSLWTLGWICGETGQELSGGLLAINQSIKLHEKLADEGDRVCAERLASVRACREVLLRQMGRDSSG